MSEYFSYNFHFYAEKIWMSINMRSAYTSSDEYEIIFVHILAPYDSHKKEAAIRAFWIQEHAQVHPEKLPLPLSINFTMHQDQQLSQDVVNEMVSVPVV